MKNELPEVICEFCYHYDEKRKVCSCREFSDIESPLVCDDYQPKPFGDEDWNL